MLKELGVTRLAVTTTTSGAMSKMLTTVQPIDCTIAELRGSQVNGFQLLKTIRLGEAKPMRPDSCFILVTDALDAARAVLARALDVNAVLLSPLSTTKLSEGIVRARTRSFPIQTAKYIAVPVLAAAKPA
jgi:CheY-like chemotaxis protein